MTKLEQLIKELCPNGVKYKSLGDTCSLVTGATPSKTNPAYWENGTIPWMSSGEVNNRKVYDTETKITQLGYDKTSTSLVPVHSVVIALAGQGKTRGKVAITEIELCTNQSLCSIICGKELNYKYLYYYLDSKYEELREISNGDGTRGGLSLRILKPYVIPIPPLEVQAEIVNLLDEYTESITALQHELEKELAARKKQYEYYRDLLLDFGVHGGGASECEWRTMGEISSFSQGLQVPVNEQFDYCTNGMIRFLRIIDFVGNEEPYRYIYIPNSKYIKKESELIMIRYGADAAGRVFTEHEGAIANNMFKIQISSSIITVDFLKHYLSLPKIYHYLHNSAKSTMPSINFSTLEKVRVPIPPIKEQERIVSILDRFDKLCNDISEGLPAEIEARRKQYEYYRDKLLSFNVREC